MARCYANENFPLPVVEALRKLGHDVLTVREAGSDNQRVDDTEVLAFAIAQRRAVITLNGASGKFAVFADGSGSAALRRKSLTVSTEFLPDAPLNRYHFVRLHRQQPQHWGIIACTEDRDYEGQASRIDAAIGAVGSLDGQLVRVNRPAQQDL